MELDKDIEEMQKKREELSKNGVQMSAKFTGEFDQDLYGVDSKKNMSQFAYDEVNDDDDDDDDDEMGYHSTTRERIMKERALKEKADMESLRSQGLGVEEKINNDNNNYVKQVRQKVILSPSRKDVFDDSTSGRDYKSIMKEQQLKDEEARVRKEIERKQEQEQIKLLESKSKWNNLASSVSSKWDNSTSSASSKWDQPTPRASSVDSTPVSSKWDQPTPMGRSSKWDATPLTIGQTPNGKRSRWDETPADKRYQATNTVASLMTPGSLTKTQQEMVWRNKPLTDADLDRLLPPGYEIVPPPASYKPQNNHTTNLFAAPTPSNMSGFVMSETPTREIFGMETPCIQDVPLYDVDQQFFSDLLKPVDEKLLTKEEARDRKIAILILRVKNGNPLQRKQALKTITEKAPDFGAEPILERLLPLLGCPDIDGQERHLLVKVLDRVLFKLDAKVRPYAHKILVVVEPMLIESDRFVRIEGREVISNLAKAAGLSTMISSLRPDLDSEDEQIRNITSRAFAVVASALGIQNLCRFFEAVCTSKKKWTVRHTGIRTIQQLAILVGISVLPHLNSLIKCIKNGLHDEQKSVRIMTAQAIAALAESCRPYGYESFRPLLEDLLEGIKTMSGKCLGAYLNALGYIIPLMGENANKLIGTLLPRIISHFESPDDEIRRIILKVIQHCVMSQGVLATDIRKTIMDPFFKSFWIRRSAMETKFREQLISTTVEIAKRVGGQQILHRILRSLKDENEPFRMMTLETIYRIIHLLGTNDLTEENEVNRIFDGVYYVFLNQATSQSSVLVRDVAGILNGFGLRAKPYLSQLPSTLKSRMSNRNANIRMQAADLISKIADLLKLCGEYDSLKLLGGVLYEFLGEEYPDVLGSILNALKSIVNVMEMTEMNPPIKDLLLHLTPILMNRHEKVQENCIDLVGRIADKGSEYVSPKEWARISYDLLELLNAKKKSIRRTTINTFGYIAQALGPSDVLYSLLNNLKVQERQNRVCTTIAIAVVADTCKPFTVIPALMNEYRTPEMNVQNGVLKSLAFMFEYIGELSKNYIYSLVTLFEDALVDRDVIHRQQAAAAIAHLFVGVYALGCEDAVQDLFNFVWPNIFEESPHLNRAVFAAIEGARLSLGAPTVLMYSLQGLFHPARRVRETYWKIYNNLYVYSADALTQAYPCLENDMQNRYDRDYMDMFI